MKFREFQKIKDKLTESGLIIESMNSKDIRQQIREHVTLNEAGALDGIMSYLKGLKAVAVASAKVPQLDREIIDAEHQATINRVNAKNKMDDAIPDGLESAKKKALKEKNKVKLVALEQKFDKQAKAKQEQLEDEIKDLEEDLPKGILTRQYKYSRNVQKAEYEAESLIKMVDGGYASETEVKNAKEAITQAKADQPEQTEEERESEYKAAQDRVKAFKEDWEKKYPKDGEKKPEDKELLDHKKNLKSLLDAQLAVADKEDNDRTKTLKNEIADVKDAIKKLGGKSDNEENPEEETNDEDKPEKNSKEGKIKRYKALADKTDDEEKKKKYQEKIKELTNESDERFLDEEFNALIEAELVQYEKEFNL